MRSGIIAYILTGLSLPNELITIDRRRIHPWAWPSDFTGGIKVIKFIHSFIPSNSYIELDFEKQ